MPVLVLILHMQIAGRSNTLASRAIFHRKWDDDAHVQSQATAGQAGLPETAGCYVCKTGEVAVECNPILQEAICLAFDALCLLVFPCLFIV